ncbi:general transcription factor IIH subunit 2-like [Bolinopsis microptera]|uniref:general transcription factor IIH subunit 2-like n=1 Tax=Bolinopsis microptera TaxID=2820187 RepID=UPI003079DB37
MDEDGDGYRWEGNYEKTWELIKETDGGLVDLTTSSAKREKRRLIQQRLSNVKLGVMRHVFLLLDQSVNMEDNDLKPSRFICLKKLSEQFILEFYDQNPISQIGVIAVKNGKGQKISDLSSNINKHIANIKAQKACEGAFSLYNGLETAFKILSSMPSYASREIIIVAGSLTSVDPHPINDMLTQLAESNIRVSVIGLSASVQIFNRVSSATNGTYNVMLDEQHLQELLRLQCAPPAATPTMEPSLVKMGFPPHVTDGTLSLCQCHVEDKTKAELTTQGFTCPTCSSKYCEVPVECKICSLTLVCAPHLARSYHHLFPLSEFTETSTEDLIDDTMVCGGCSKTFANQKHVYRCRCIMGYKQELNFSYLDR